MTYSDDPGTKRQTFSLLSRFTKWGILSPAAFWALGLVALLPQLTKYLWMLWQDEHYRYFPFLFIAVGTMAWSRVRLPLQFPRTALSFSLLTFSVALFALGGLCNSPWLAAIAFVVFVASFCTAHGVFYLCVPFVLLIRLPLGFDLQIITALQSLTTRLSSLVLDLLAVSHSTHGNVIELADRELLVAEACSGVQSAFTIAFVSLCVVTWYQRPLILVPLHLIVSLIWAVLCNMLRVTTIAYVAARYQIDLSEGWPHEALGYVTLILAVLLTLSTDALLNLVFHPVGHEAEESNPLIRLWERLFSRLPSALATQDSYAMEASASDAPVVGALHSRVYQAHQLVLEALLLLSFVSFVPLAANAMSETPPALVAVEPSNLLLDPPPTLFDHIQGRVAFRYAESMRDGDDPRLGHNADQWDVQCGSVKGRLVLSQPYSRWHDLTICYEGQGWVLESVNLLPLNQSPAAPKIKLGRLVRNDGTHGYLIYTGVNAQGEILDPPGMHSLLGKLIARCTSLFREDVVVATDETAACAMLQMWVVSQEEIEGETVGELIESIGMARESIALEFRRKMGNTP